MKKYFIVISLLFINNITFSQDYDLLLGLRYEKDVSEDRTNFNNDDINVYSTFWISTLNDTIAVISKIREIILPNDTSYYRMGIRRSYYNYWAEDLFWFLPIAEDPDVGISNSRGESCYGTDKTYINFIGDNYISISNWGSGRCYGGGPSSMWGDSYLVPIDNLINYKGTMNDLYFGSIDESIYWLIDSSFIMRYVTENASQIHTVPANELWKLTDLPHSAKITHDKGQFFMDDVSEYSSNSARGFIHAIVLDDSLPAKNTIDNINTPVWNVVQSKMPDATDIIISPDRKYAVIAASDSIFMCKLNNNEIILPAYNTHPVYGLDAKIIMYKWYSGDERIKHSNTLKNIRFTPYASRIY